MDPSSVPPKAYPFRMKCGQCQKKFTKLLRRQNGVYTVGVEGGMGIVTKNSSVNPGKSVATIGEASGETSCEGQTVKPPPNEKENNNHEQVDVCVCQSLFKDSEGAYLQELAKTNKLKQLNFSKNLQMTFSEEKDDNGASQKVYDNKGTPLEPKKDNDQNHFVGTNASQHEPKPKEAGNLQHCAESGVTHGGPHHHASPHCHGCDYYPRTHHNYPPPPPKAKDVDKPCVSKYCSIL